MKTMSTGIFCGWNSEHPQLEKIGFVHQNMGIERKGVPNKGECQITIAFLLK